MKKSSQNKAQRNRSHQKDFRYPLIIPIVYYERKRYQYTNRLPHMQEPVGV